MNSFAIKAYAVGGTIYLTKAHGVWGSSTQSVELYNDINKQLQPHINTLKSSIPFETPALPNDGKICYTVKHYYNAGVKKTIYTIQMIPCYLGQATKKTIDTLKNALEAPPPAKE